MGYEIHIKRDGGAGITIDEWCAAVAQTERMRLAYNDAFALNPATSDKIRIPVRMGDVEVYFPDDGVWVPCLLWSADRISFRATADFDGSESWFRQAIVALAKQLGARVVGDEGEVYE